MRDTKIGDRFEYGCSDLDIERRGVWEIVGTVGSYGGDVYYYAVRIHDGVKDNWAFDSFDYWVYLGNFSKDRNVVSLYNILSNEE